MYLQLVITATLVLAREVQDTPGVRKSSTLSTFALANLLCVCVVSSFQHVECSSRDPYL